MENPKLNKIIQRISESYRPFTIDELRELLPLIKDNESYSSIEKIKFPTHLQGLEMAIEHLRAAYKVLNTNTLKGQRVIDLGCGSFSFQARGIWHPYFAMLCALDGALTIGIDLHANTDQPDVPYFHLQADVGDLILDYSLDRILSKEPTIIRANYLLNSPEMDNLPDESQDALRIELHPTLKYIIQEGGIILCDIGYNRLTFQLRARGFKKQQGEFIYFNKKGEIINSET